MKNFDHPSRRMTKTDQAIADKIASLESDARWQDRAACKELDSAIFFGPDQAETVKEKRDREDAAKVFCRTCPVRVECLEYAIGHREPYGIWGGMTELERKQELRRRGPRPGPYPAGQPI